MREVSPRKYKRTFQKNKLPQKFRKQLTVSQGIQRPFEVVLKLHGFCEIPKNTTFIESSMQRQNVSRVAILCVTLN